MQVAEWQREFPDTCPQSVSVNFSGRQLQEPDLVETVVAALDESGLSPKSLVIEVTESVLLENMATVLPRLERLRGLGIRLAIDDFGTGYSSLSYLHQFPLDILKIDRTFVSGIGTAQQDASLVKTIVTMGQMLNLLVVAEGIELIEELEELRRLGCDLGQGYYFSRPADAETIREKFIQLV